MTLGWAAVVWLGGWSLDCGQLTFHRCDGCRDKPEPSWGRWLTIYLYSLVFWWANLAGVLHFDINRRKNRGKRS